MSPTLLAVYLVIFVAVLVLPLVSHRVERNLEAFLFVMGLTAAIAAGVLTAALVRDALIHPLPITAAVLVAGLLFKWGRRHLSLALSWLQRVLPARVVPALLVVLLGLLSSVITAIIAALVLVECVRLLRFSRRDEEWLVIVACMAIGLGAALTPVGEPLSTIATAKLGEDFWFLMRLLGPWIIPGVVLLGVWTSVRGLHAGTDTLSAATEEETYRGVAARAIRVYLFVMALVFLGEGFKPIIDRFIIQLDARILYFINMISAILDNATLTAAEIGPGMNLHQVRAALMGLLISGGMLIPGNIPNIIAANRLEIRSRAWARLGIPLGLVLLAVYFVVLFVL